MSLSKLFLALYEFIKAVSDTVFDKIDAVYHGKPSVFIKDVSACDG